VNRLFLPGGRQKPMLAGGGGATFSPNDVSGLVQWLDFSDITTLYQTEDTSTPVTADGQSIGYCADKSGNSKHATQATAANRPTYKASQQNGLSIARFAGGGSPDALLSTAETLANMTVFSVLKSGGTSSLYISTFGTNNNALIQGYVAGKIEWYNSPRTIIGDISTSNFQNIYTALGSATNGSAWTIGAAISLSNPWVGDLGEMLVYNSALSAENIALVVSYIASKWNVSGS